MKKVISIVVPVYNVEQYVEKCLTSIINQDIPHESYEIIVVNDGSKDNSLKIVENFAKKNQNIRVISQPNKGLSGARNTGIQYAVGDYIWFVDSDDWIKENCLKNVVETCSTQNLDVLQICAARVVNGVPVRRFHRPHLGEIHKGKDLLKERFPFCAPFSIYRREFLKINNLQFMEGIYHEDNEFSPRVFYYANRIASIDDVLYFVFPNPNSITRTRNPKKSKDCILVMNSHHQFSLNVENEIKKSFSNIITSTMNVALHDALYLEKEDKLEISRLLYENRHLYRHLLNADSIEYKIEGLLLSLFPKYPINVYKLLNIFDKRDKKKKEI